MLTSSTALRHTRNIWFTNDCLGCSLTSMLCKRRSGAQRQASLQIKNGEDISKLLPACYLRDRKDNLHHTLPPGLDLTTTPQLQVSPAQIQDSTQRAPCFVRGGTTLLNVLTGVWSFETSTGLLSLTEMGIVGTPGPVYLTLSDGVNSQGTPIQAATLHAELTLGELAKDKLEVNHWPTGECIIGSSLCFYPSPNIRSTLSTEGVQSQQLAFHVHFQDLSLMSGCNG